MNNTYQNKQWLQEKYLSDHLTFREIGKICGVSREAIRRWMVNFGIPARDKYENHRKSSIDLSVLSQWSSDMAYIIGYAYADGNISNTSKKRGLTFVSIDRTLLEKVSRALKYTGKIYQRKQGVGNTAYSLEICHYKLPLILERYGLFPRKSLTIELPSIPSEYFGDFVRGYFDGDGCISRSKKYNGVSVSFSSGSVNFLNSLADRLSNLGVSSKTPMFRAGDSGNCYVLKYSARSDVIIMYDLLYKNFSELFLDRKKNIFDDFLTQYSTPVPPRIG